MASSSSSQQQNALFVIEAPNKPREVEESSRVFDVFINHRGPDVKNTLAAHLYNSLKALGIKTFLDSEEKELGDSFPSLIETAISSASVHIAIFSKRYAESAWCLAELVLMSQSKGKIIPVFYQVEPWELRYFEKEGEKRGVYAEAFVKHEGKNRYPDKQLDEWKKTLQQISYTAGHEFKTQDYGHCKDIVSAVEKEVQRTKRLLVAKYPVGLNKLVKDFERRCLDELVQDFESQCGTKKANVVGIFGMGGVGKTTLSKELFNQKKSKYTRASFLFDVREAWASGKFPLLQSRLLKDIFCEDRNFLSPEEGTSYLRDCLERNSAFSFLIVLDDIDRVDQLDSLLVMDILNRPGNNLVLVTTREVGVLTSARIDTAYHLKGLDREDGRELFCWHAFGQSHPCRGYEDLVQGFVNICGGLPLSLQVLGRHVSGRKEWYWQEELQKARKALPGDIKQRLRISFDGLDDEEKQIFLDIACFFIDKSIATAMTIWKGSGWRGRHGLEKLKEKCLIEENVSYLPFLEWEVKWKSRQDEFAFRMHDHLRDLGRELANELSHPRRLWQPKDLKSLESKEFQNIVARTTSRCFHSILDKSMDCQITFFIGEPEDSSETSLLWLQLDYLNRTQLETNSDINPSIPQWIDLQNLKCLRISGGRFQRLWQSDEQAPTHLKELQVRETFVKEFPDLLRKLNNVQEVEIIWKR
ncbi:hypothetical protein SUGI_0674840 [Cryptomeria japonica]|uniref:disease resistance protein Roq1-like n=1 Tax=Cryptomeria japonica TaxID=3369 RepID=UPI002414C032|nr:disease resistance protein Roq1-like [Cryptomeria japonica]GLJ33560.1 hypothetical protein SUGI_0674840 [Cryptomeria japonica]